MTTEAVGENTEARMLARAFEVERGDWPKEIAQVLLGARLPEPDIARMLTLGERAQRGELTPAERREAEAYDRVGLLIELLQSKARLSLKKHS